MSLELRELLSYVIESKDKVLTKKIASIILKYSIDEEAIGQAKQVLSDGVDIDLWELESLVRPEKFEFPEPDIGMIGVENEGAT